MSPIRPAAAGRAAAYAPSPLDDRARTVVEGLHARSRSQTRAGLVPMLTHAIRSRLRAGTWDPTQSPDGKAWLADKLVALDPHKAALCYLLCRTLNARRVVEAGTSYGVSTIYLAAAVRDNLTAAADQDTSEVAGTTTAADRTDADLAAEAVSDRVGEAVVIGTEHEPGKVTAARANLADAGLSDYVQILGGDLRETLPEVTGPIDFLLVDIWIPMALPALQIITPTLRPGALVVCDNVVAGRTQYADYLAYVRDPAGPFTSLTLPGHGGLEISRKT